MKLIEYNKILLQKSLTQVGLPLILVKAQAKNLCFLLDTGSNINVLDKRVAEFFQLSGGTAQQQQFGIDGTLQTTDVVEMTFSLEEPGVQSRFLGDGFILGFWKSGGGIGHTDSWSVGMFFYGTAEMGARL